MEVPQSWNRYTYTINNPLSYIDPNGLDWRYSSGENSVKWFEDGAAAQKGWVAVTELPNTFHAGHGGVVYYKVGDSLVYLNPQGPGSRPSDSLIEVGADPNSPIWANGWSSVTPSMSVGPEAGLETDFSTQFIIGGILNGARGLTMGFLEGLAARSAQQTLWRAVTNQELDDIVANGAFRNAAGAEVKYFSETAEGAAQYGRMATDAFKDGPYTLVRTTMPRNLITPEMRAVVDNGIQTVTVPTRLLPTLSKPVVQGGIN